MVGFTPNIAEKAIQDLWMKNLIPDEFCSNPHFYIQSGLCYGKMLLHENLMMKVLLLLLKVR